MADNKAVEEAEKKDPASTGTSKKKEQKRNIISRIWNGIFRVHGDDFEKRLKYISKEEAAVLARIKRRAQTWRLRSRQLILFSLFCEVLAVGFAVMMTRSTDLDWKMRAVYVLPVFIWPVFSYFSHSALVGWTKRRDLKDQKTLERLRAERQAKINELKERTNYYSTQQLIQRYDPDPAAKAAAATVLASKLGAESGLKVYLGDESTDNAPTGKSNDVEVVQSGGLRNRKQPNMRSTSTGNTPMVSSEAASPHSDSAPTPDHNQVVDHHIPQGQSGHDGGWISRIAALLVGEDPTQSYALICGNCRMHNGLARKEEFPFITYYCPHCHALNRPKESAEQVSGTSSLNLGTLTPGVSGDTISTVTSDLSPDEITALTASVSGGTVSNPNGSPSESILTSSITAVTGPETEGESEKVAESDVVD